MDRKLLWMLCLVSFIGCNLALENATCVDQMQDLSQSEQCECAIWSDAESNAIFSYLYTHYCWMRNYPLVSIGGMSAWLLFLFYIIAGTTDHYLVPALSVGVEKTSMSPNLAGSTILAFANGAPDVFTSLAAFSGTAGDSDLGMGSLLGSGLFVTTFTLGTVSVLAKNDLGTCRRPFLRDLIAYGTAVGLLFYMCLDNKVTWAECIIYLVMYALYVLVVVVGHFIYVHMIKPRNAPSIYESNVEEPNWNGTRRRQRDDLIANVMPAFDDAADAYMYCGDDTVRSSASDAKVSRTVTLRDTRPNALSYLKKDSTEHDISSILRLHGSSRSINDMEKRSFDKSILEQFIQWEDRNAFGKMLSVVELPLTIARRLTIPLVEESSWNRYFTAISMLGLPIFALLCTRDFNIVEFTITSVIGLGLALLTFLCTTNDLPESRYVLLPIVLVSFAASSFWAYLIANEIVDVMQCIGLGLGVSSSILGVTVLAWGNSIGDLISNISLVKSGNGRMASSECFGGPIFNLMFGGGLSFIIGIAANSSNFLVVGAKPVTGYAFVILAISLVSTAIVVPFQGFQYTSKHGWYLVFLYAAFTVLSVLAELQVIPAIM